MRIRWRAAYPANDSHDAGVSLWPSIGGSYCSHPTKASGLRHNVQRFPQVTAATAGQRPAPKLAKHGKAWLFEWAVQGHSLSGSIAFCVKHPNVRKAKATPRPNFESMLRRSVGVLFCRLIEENVRQFCGDVPPLIGHTPVSSAAKSSLCWQTLAKRSDRISRVTLLRKLATFRRKNEVCGCCGRIAQGMENCKVGRI